MKRGILFLFMALVFATACDKDNEKISGPVTRDQAVKLCKEYIDASDEAIVLNDIVLPNTDLSYNEYTNYSSPNYSAWLIIVTPNIFVDTIQSDWMIFVNIDNGELEIIKEVAFNRNNYDFTIIKGSKQSKATLINYVHPKKRPLVTKASPLNNNYAVIISGGNSPEDNYARYYNNCKHFYNTLVDIYGYQKSNIKLLFANGTDNTNNMNYAYGSYVDLDDYPLDFDDDGLNDIDYAATIPNLLTVFSDLSLTLQPGDNLVIYVTDHGVRVLNESWICLWGDWLQSSQFAQMISSIPQSVKIQIILGQCYSGGFISSLSGNNRVIATSCAANEAAYANYQHSIFLNYFTSALAERFPSGESVPSDDDGWYGVSFKEAYDYAYSRAPEGNTPQYNSVPSDFGYIYSISGDNVAPPVLSGPDNLQYPSDGYFSVSGKHEEDSAVSWDCLNYQHVTTTSDSTATVPSNYSSVPYNRLQMVASVTTKRGVKTLSKWFTIWKGGIYTYTYNVTTGSGQCKINNDGRGFVLVDHNTDMTDFSWGTDSNAINIAFNGYYFTDYSVNGNITYPFTVTCSYDNPYGQKIHIVQTYNN